MLRNILFLSVNLYGYSKKKALNSVIDEKNK